MNSSTRGGCRPLSPPRGACRRGRGHSGQITTTSVTLDPLHRCLHRLLPGRGAPSQRASARDRDGACPICMEEAGTQGPVTVLACCGRPYCLPCISTHCKTQRQQYGASRVILCP